MDEAEGPGEVGERARGTVHLPAQAFRRVPQVAATAQARRTVPSLHKSEFYVVVRVSVSAVVVSE